MNRRTAVFLHFGTSADPLRTTQRWCETVRGVIDGLRRSVGEGERFRRRSEHLRGCGGDPQSRYEGVLTSGSLARFQVTGALGFQRTPGPLAREGRMAHPKMRPARTGGLSVQLARA